MQIVQPWQRHALSDSVNFSLLLNLFVCHICLGTSASKSVASWSRLRSSSSLFMDCVLPLTLEQFKADTDKIFVKHYSYPSAWYFIIPLLCLFRPFLLLLMTVPQSDIYLRLHPLVPRTKTTYFIVVLIYPADLNSLIQK